MKFKVKAFAQDHKAVRGRTGIGPAAFRKQKTYPQNQTKPNQKKLLNNMAEVILALKLEV